LQVHQILLKSKGVALKIVLLCVVFIWNDTITSVNLPVDVVKYFLLSLIDDMDKGVLAEEHCPASQI
jgi:hypothetical protein